jgi:serine/threonine protein kinase
VTAGDGTTGTPDPWILDTVTAAVGDSLPGWQIKPATDSLQPWIYAHPRGPALPQQGWKLHISSYTSTAAETFRRALPPLVAEGVGFKVIGSLGWLAGLNRGAAGLSQVGKAITVYPRDEGSALEVAAALAAATRGMCGPRIPSDRAYADGDVLFYRYGGFGDLQMQTRLGDVVLALRNPDGTLVPDLRGATPYMPPWGNDPFQQNGLAAAHPLAATVAGRYRPVMTLAHSPAAVIQLALDVAVPRVCVLKRAQTRPADHDIEADDGGLRLRREIDVLTRLSGQDVAPAILDVVENDHDLILVSEDLGGETLDRQVGKLATAGCVCPPSGVVELGVAIADALAVIHEAGHVHGDLKSANIILTAGGGVRLIDFDLAYPIGSTERPPGAGTRGYVSPGGRAGHAVSPADDIHALGAVLYLLLTGAEPSRAPDPGGLLCRPPGQLNPAADTSLIEVVSRCLDRDPARRFGSARDVRRALLTVSQTRQEPPGPPARHPAEIPELLSQARRAGDYICAQASSSGAGVTWRSRYYVGKGLVGRDINTGMAGTILALAELTDELRVPHHADVLRAAARTLHAMPPVPGDRPRGLYVGDMGLVAALLRAGQVLRDDDLLQYAVDRAETQPAPSPDDSPDLFHGLAGRLLANLMLWDETGGEESLDRAVACGDALLRQRESEPGVAQWRIPSGYGDLSGKSLPGYAHGAAGIADALLDLYEATGTPEYEKTSCQAIAWIIRQAIPCLDDRSGLAWPVYEGSRPHPPFWCHGAAGIGRLFLHARRLGVGPDTTEMLPKICRSVALGARWSGPTLCHGLAGNAEFLIDAGQALGDDGVLAQASGLVGILDAFAVDSPDGRAWISEAPRQINPDYLVGYAGIPLVLLRLARPARRYQLSRAGFRYRGGQGMKPLVRRT